MKILISICLGVGSALALAQSDSSQDSNTLQKHLDKYPNSGWVCILRKKQYRVDPQSDEVKCRRLGGKIHFSKNLKRDLPTLDQIESLESKSERQRLGH